jgi:hypothetical protein
MTILIRLNKSLDEKDLKEFTECVNHPALYINDVFEAGLLHHMLANYPTQSIDFYKIVIDNPNTNLNLHNATKLPPLISTQRSDIIDLLLANLLCNVNVTFIREKQTSIVNHIVDTANLELLEKIIATHRLDIELINGDLDEDMSLLNYSMTKNMDIFKVILENSSVYCRGKYNPLKYSITLKNVLAFQMLLEKGCKIETNSLEHILNSGNSDMISVMTKYLTSVANKELVLKKSMETGNVELFREVSKYTTNITSDMIKSNLDNVEMMDEIVNVANRTNDENIVRSLFGLINEIKDVSIFQKIKVDSNNILYEMIAFNRIDEIDKLVLNTEIVKDNLKGTVEQFINILIKNDKIESLKKVLDTYNFILDKKLIKIEKLISNNRFDILLQLLSKYTIYIENNDVIDRLVLKNQYSIVLILVEKYNIIPRNVKILQQVISNNDELMVALLSKEPGIFIDNIDIKTLIKITGLINGDLFDRFLSDSYITIKLTGFYRDNTLEELFKHPQLMLKILTHPGISNIHIFTPIHEKYPLLEMLYLLKGENRDMLVDYIKGLNDRLSDHFFSLEPLNYIIEKNDIELFRYILGKFDYTFEEGLDAFMEVSNKMFVLDHIDDILMIKDSSISSGLVPLLGIMDDPTYNEAFTRSNVIDKLIDRGMIDTHSLIYNDMYFEDGLTIFEVVIDTLYRDDNNVKNWSNSERIRIVKKLLELPDINVNMENSNGETIAQVIIDSISDFGDIDYEDKETFSYSHALLKLIINHHSFDINANRKIFIDIINDTERDFAYLLTLIISKPNFDVNHCRLLHSACYSENINVLKIVLRLPTVDVNLVAVDDEEGTIVTPMHVAIEQKFIEGIKLLLEDPRLDVAFVDSKGRNYARIAAKTGTREIVSLFASRGITDDKQAKLEKEIAEYDANMAARGRVKQTRIRETLNSFDLILKERERIPGEDEYNITAYNLSLCPFCLTYLEKENPYDCIYLGGHKCPEELENEPLKRLYFGDQWQTTVFEICCTCGRPCQSHGHFKTVEEGSGTSVLAINSDMANHWSCDSHNGGGGKLEMVTRLIGMLSELKRRVDNDERLVYGPELIRELAITANRSLFNGSIHDRALAVFQRKKWNVNSKIQKHIRFNANNSRSTRSTRNNNTGMRNVREPIVHYDNRENHIEQCMICLEYQDYLFKPHAGDEGYICGYCIKGQVCSSRYASVTCELGCKPKKQIYKEDVNALMGGNFCQ